MTQNNWIPAGEAAKVLGVSKRRVYQLIHDKLLRAEKIEGLWAIQLSELKNRKPLRPWDRKKNKVTTNQKKT